MDGLHDLHCQRRLHCLQIHGLRGSLPCGLLLRGFNRKYAEMWPVIITKKDPLPEAEERDGESGKLEKYFSEAPGEGG